MAPKRVLKCLSIEDKFKLIKEIESGSKKKDMAVKYCIPASTISTILKNKDSIITSFESGTSTGSSKRMKKPMFENVDKAILDWFTAARDQNMPISSNVLKKKALEFAKRFGSDNFKASTGWLDKWKQRHGVCRKKVCDENNAVRGEDCNNWTTGVLPHLLEKCNELDIFIADETGLFYKCLPNKTLTSKNEQCHGGKHAMESDDEDSVKECIQQPSKNDVVDSLRYLNLYLQSNDNTTDDHYEALNKLEALFAENIEKK